MRTNNVIDRTTFLLWSCQLATKIFSQTLWSPILLSVSPDLTHNTWCNSDMWHVTRDMWHLTCDTWHVTSDMLWGVNILSKFQQLCPDEPEGDGWRVARASWWVSCYTRLKNLAWFHTVFFQFIFCRKCRFMNPLLCSSPLINAAPALT